MMIRKTRIILMTAILTLTAIATTRANDAVYFVNGNHLEPLEETDIAIQSEVLTITLKDDGLAYVEVDYKFFNNGDAKDVTMGFEATAPYNDGEPVKLNGAHPYIKDFSVVMNGNTLNFSNGLVFTNNPSNDVPKEVETAKKKGQYFIPIDLKRWKFDDEDSERFYNASTDEYASFSYAYYFKAHFNKGVNTVRHTYSYRISFGVGMAFDIPYWLLPAMRWANHQIDDFTLKIRAPKCTKHFFIDNTPFEGGNFRVTEGKGKTRLMKVDNFEDTSMVTEVVLRDGTLEWHGNNFRPKQNMSIESADQLRYLVEWGDEPIPMYYDSGDTFFGSLFGEYSSYFPKLRTEKEMEDFAKRVQRNLPYAHRGYVFKDAQLKKYFESLWWYMPDPSWKPTDNSLSTHEKEWLKFILEENN